MNFATNKLIAHGLMKIENRYLVIKRTAIKRGKPNAYPEYWNIPGGMVEPGETPVEGVIREVKEEVNLDIKVNKIIHEDAILILKKIVFLHD
jgi:8-oxo-dGTP pyrophosphatase MutT (NUDIX family)